MDDSALREQMFNLASNRAGNNGDVVALATSLYDFAKTGEPYRMALVTANNRVSPSGSPADLLEMAKSIVAFINPTATIPNIVLPLTMPVPVPPAPVPPFPLTVNKESDNVTK